MRWSASIRTKRLRWVVPIAGVITLVGVASAFGALGESYTPPASPLPQMAESSFARVTGAATGLIQGGVTEQGHVGDMRVLALDLGASRPFDPHSGFADGHFMCRGVNFRKPVDRASPLLFRAAASSENLRTVVFTESVRTTAGPASPYTVELRNATIASFHEVNAATTGAYDDIELRAAEITLTWGPGGISATVGCDRPQ